MNRKKHGSVIAGLLLLGLVFLWGCSGPTGSIVAVTGVTLSVEGNSNIVVDKTKQLVWVVSPSDATVQRVTFSSDAEGVATVSAGGLVTAVAEGNATITVTTDDGNKTATVTVKVVATVKTLTGITITDGSSLTLTGPESRTLAVTLTPPDATEDIVWSSSDSATVSVNSGGIITAKKASTESVTITVAKDGDDSVKADITITVAEPPRGIKITGLPVAWNGDLDIAVFDKNSQEEVLEDPEGYEAGFTGTITDGVINGALRLSGNGPWLGTGSYYVGFKEEDVHDKGYLSNGKVSFSFDNAWPELSFTSFKELSVGAGEGGGGDRSIKITDIPGTVNGMEYCLELWADVDKEDFWQDIDNLGGVSEGTISGASMTIVLDMDYVTKDGTSYYVTLDIFDDGQGYSAAYISKQPADFSSGNIPELSLTSDFGLVDN
jgi:hypothetical protein